MLLSQICCQRGKTSANYVGFFFFFSDFPIYQLWGAYAYLMRHLPQCNFKLRRISVDCHNEWLCFLMAHYSWQYLSPPPKAALILLWLWLCHLVYVHIIHVVALINLGAHYSSVARTESMYKNVFRHPQKWKKDKNKASTVVAKHKQTCRKLIQFSALLEIMPDVIS